jgi:hypothetical protein
MKVKVVSKDVDTKENGVKAWVVLKHSHACSIAKLQKKCL